MRIIGVLHSGSLGDLAGGQGSCDAAPRRSNAFCPAMSVGINVGIKDDG